MEIFAALCFFWDPFPATPKSFYFGIWDKSEIYFTKLLALQCMARVRTIALWQTLHDKIGRRLLSNSKIFNLTRQMKIKFSTSPKNLSANKTQSDLVQKTSNFNSFCCFILFIESVLAQNVKQYWYQAVFALKLLNSIKQLFNASLNFNAKLSQNIKKVFWICFIFC